MFYVALIGLLTDKWYVNHYASYNIFHRMFDIEQLN